MTGNVGCRELEIIMGLFRRAPKSSVVQVAITNTKRGKYRWSGRDENGKERCVSSTPFSDDEAAATAAATAVFPDADVIVNIRNIEDP